MKKILIILFASFLIISCSDNKSEILPNLSVLISSPDESTKYFGDSVEIYLGANLATAINVKIYCPLNAEVYNNTLYYDAINGSCQGPGCLDCLAQCEVKDLDFRYSGYWIPTCCSTGGDECSAGTYILEAEATNEDGQTGSTSVSFLVQM
tara:strand:+ start:37 stop:489 length:453 start_codon:yes stop_codon:yes gene_type:complete